MGTTKHQDSPPENFPLGLSRLRQLGEALVTSSPTLATGVRVVVTLPTLRLAATAAALGAVVTETACIGCAHRHLVPGQRVAGVVSGRYDDATLVSAAPQLLDYGGIKLTDNLDSVHMLPENFPTRKRTMFGPELRADVAAALDCPPARAAHRQSARSAHPVVIAGEPAAFAEDVDRLATAVPAAHVRGFLDPGVGINDWFRHPVLVMAAVPGRADAPWVEDVRPRLVVLAGSTSWLSSARNHWPDVPVLVLLSRRSPSDCAAGASIATSGWPRISAAQVGLSDSAGGPGVGVEIMIMTEPVDGRDDDEEVW